jgi:hypothetical protein
MKKRNNRIWIIWAILFIVLPPIIGYLFKGPEIFSSLSYYFTYTSIGYAYGIIFPVGNSLIGKYFDTLDWERNPKRTNLITFMVFMGYSIIMGILIPYTIDRFLWGMSGKDVFYDVSAKAFIITVISLVVFYFYNTTLISNNWIKTIEKNEELKRENLLAKYEALKNQVNPHFLFNNLNTLSGMVEQKNELTTEFIKKLSDIYRYVLEQTDKELVSIKEEMKFVEDYVFLSKMRFGEGIIYKSHLSETNNFQVAPLGIQMLVENAIKHNVLSEELPLMIEIGAENGFVFVRNNRQKRNLVYAGKEPLGLENLKSRYAYLSGIPVDVSESNGNFVVKLPVIETLQ